MKLEYRERTNQWRAQVTAEQYDELERTVPPWYTFRLNDGLYLMYTSEIVHPHDSVRQWFEDRLRLVNNRLNKSDEWVEV